MTKNDIPGMSTIHFIVKNVSEEFLLHPQKSIFIFQLNFVAAKYRWQNSRVNKCIKLQIFQNFSIRKLGSFTFAFSNLS